MCCARDPCDSQRRERATSVKFQITSDTSSRTVSRGRSALRTQSRRALWPDSQALRQSVGRQCVSVAIMLVAMVAKGRADGAKGARARGQVQEGGAVGKAANFYKTATAGALAVPAGLDEPDAAAPAVVAGSKEVPDVCKNMLKPYKGDLFTRAATRRAGCVQPLAHAPRRRPREGAAPQEDARAREGRREGQGHGERGGEPRRAERRDAAAPARQEAADDTGDAQHQAARARAARERRRDPRARHALARGMQARRRDEDELRARADEPRGRARAAAQVAREGRRGRHRRAEQIEGQADPGELRDRAVQPLRARRLGEQAR